MVNVPGTPSALTLASAVVGQGTDDQIVALVANGDKLRGQVVLRISVTVPGSGFQQGSQAVRCYRYDFRNSISDSKPQRTSCPVSDPLVVSPPPVTPSASS